MRLLYHDEENVLRLTSDLTKEERPRYAILSHTWLLNNENEVSFEDLTQGNAHAKPDGYTKIHFCAKQAAKDGLKHFWLDTCCIDKRSSAEVQEAITTMYSWYRDAVRCYVYLTDVSVGQEVADDGIQQSSTHSWESAFRHSRWFTRGWTLQELLAPSSVEFFSKEGRKLGDKTSLMPIIHEITGIPGEALHGTNLSNFSVEERLSWAAKRQTKRSEDKAYCLLGIFNVFMSTIYGEEDNAFQRLRREINRKQPELANPDHFLSMLPVANEAAFNSLYNQYEPICLQNTRTELIRTIKAWFESDSESCIFWLHGIAGSGKSTVARTVARTYHDRGDLVGSFFFSKDGGDLSKANKLVTTLARQIATRVPEAKHYISEAIAKQENIMEHSIRDQWEQLIIGPLCKLTSGSAPNALLLVIDALDECDKENDIRAVIKALVTVRSLSNVRLRIFVTSRLLSSIRSGFNKLPDAEWESFVLHEIPSALVSHDLSILFEENFTMIREERGFENSWPGGWTIKRLVEISCGLFIWAATACRFIYEARRFQTIKKRINHLITGFSSGTGPEKQLDQIYTAVLQDFVQQDFDGQEEKEEMYLVLRAVLGAIAVLCAPLSMKSLAGLLDRDLSDIKDTLGDLQTVFNVPDDASQPVRLHHPTFREFLLNRKRCTDIDLWVDEKQKHKDLGDSCLALMSKMLKRNICDLESPGILVEDLDPARIQRCIPPDLQYACIYWVEHYRQSGIRLSDGDSVDNFFKEYFLYWLEAISLMGKSGEIGGIMRLYHSLLMPDYNERQIPFVKDARRLIFNFQNIIKEAPLQIYCAVLAYVPPTNELKVHFREQKHPWVKDFRIADADTPKPKDDFNYVSDLAFTPDGRKIASGSNFEAARFWDVATRTTLRKFEAGSSDKMSSVAISPNGKILAGGSDDFTVMAWDIETGAPCYRIKAHTGWVNSVFFSPNGKLLASGSMDQTIALWDAATGKEIRKIDNQSSCVNSAAFSPDGLLIATGSVDAIVRLWDVSRESDAIHMLLDGHTSPVNSVRFSPSGNQLVSGSDDMTVKLWDIITGTERMTFEGHTRKVMTVSFSLDARLIASGSEDRTVRVWDAISGTLLATLKDHTSGISSVLFSPDDTLLASSSFDDELRLWDRETWTLIGKFEDFEDDINSGTLATQRPYVPSPGSLMGNINDLKGHSGEVTRVVFSPNGQWLASGSHDATIKVWLENGIRWHLSGHTGNINHLTFSPHSNLLASASADNTVRIWDLTTGTTTYTLTGHSDNVLSVVFSPDGSLLGSCSADSTVILWELATGTSYRRLHGHSSMVSGIAFSPDNRSVVSWSTETTALLWDVSTKSRALVLEGHTCPVNSVVFSPDNESLASCSEDCTVRLWNKYGMPCGEIDGGASPIKCVAFSPDNELLAFCSISGIITFWDVKTKSSRGSYDTGVAVRALSFSTCGRYIETDRGMLSVDSLLTPSSNPPHAIFVSQDWLRRGTKNAVWLPAKYHATDVAVYGDTVVMGHSSGSISFIRLD